MQIFLSLKQNHVGEKSVLADIMLAEDPLITTSSNSQDGKSHERSSWFYPSLTMDDGFYDSDFKELTSMQYLGNIANTK